MFKHSWRGIGEHVLVDEKTSVIMIILYAHYECIEVDAEDCGRGGVECELLEEGGLNEGIGLNTFCLFHCHFQSTTADKASSHLYTTIAIYYINQLVSSEQTSLKLTVLRMEDKFLTLSILATRM